MNRKLRKMKKIELLEMLLEQEREIEELQEENEMLRKQLEERKIIIDNSGSIAEAAMKLSGVFEAAQKAADLYLKSVDPDLEETENIEKQQENTETIDSGN